MVALFVCQGCMVGPDYVRPDAAMPDRWHQEAIGGIKDGEADLQRWWTNLNDPILNDLIERAWDGNFDIKQAQARVLQSQALRGIATGEKNDPEGHKLQNRSP